MTTAQKQPDQYIGRSILNGQFLIEQKIGSGGMGAVYRAAQPAMNRVVAVKILHPKLANRKDLVSRFRREARAMSHLTHPNTVKVFLYGELEDGSLYIVMEYLEGRNLNQVVRREGPLPVERAIPVLVQVCGALHEAHSQGIIHRDLKPENIFLSTNGGLKDFAKVLDFGLAKVTERELRPGSIMLTQEGMVFGTPEFMSPEQAQGKKLDPRSDIYSLATILYEVLTGKLPFEAKTPMEYIQLHVTKPPITLDERIPGKRFPPGLSDVVMRALQKKPEDRYTTAIDLADALRPFAPGSRLTNVLPQYPDPTKKPENHLERTVPDRPLPAAQQPPQHQMPAGPAPSIDANARTMKMHPGAPIPNPLPPGMVPQPPSSNPGQRNLAPTQAISMKDVAAGQAASAPRAGGVKVTTLIVVAVVCLALGIGLTALVLHFV
ncbi:MAG: protein kinase [Polyangiaceae bacterium]